MLSDAERVRYRRNLLIAGIGEAGQERLRAAKVLVVGLGGLGSPAAFYLAAAGVGTLGLMDADVVELSNLQRQILHTTARLGRAKAESAADALTALDPAINLRLHEVRLTPENAPDLLRDYDIVVEATDNFAAQFVINDACIGLGKPFVTAGALGLSGHALFVAPGQSPCLRCVLGDPPQDGEDWREGVLGAVPGMLGCIEAMEAIRWITGLWRPSNDGAGRLHRLDGETMRLSTLRVPRRAECRCAPIGSTR
jgi:molybdopterin/thiamine biosynthesis adenylyltransferase